MANNPIKVVNDTIKLRFEVELNGQLATIDYRYYKNDIAFMHTVVPESFRGKGIASAMAVEALDFARQKGKKIMLYCPFMAGYVRGHKNYYDLVDTFFHPSFKNGNKEGN